MQIIITIFNFLFSMLILIAGIKYFKHTISYHNTSIKSITTEDILKEFKLNIFPQFIVACVSTLMPLWITNKNFDFLTDVLLSGFIISGGIEAIHYLLRRKISAEFLTILYCKHITISIFGILNGISI